MADHTTEHTHTWEWSALGEYCFDCDTLRDDVVEDDTE